MLVRSSHDNDKAADNFRRFSYLLKNYFSSSVLTTSLPS